jgi:hypothetical protein
MPTYGAHADRREEVIGLENIGRILRPRQDIVELITHLDSNEERGC